MDQDTIMPIIVVLGVIYVWGALNRGWTTPVDIGVDIDCRRGGHRWCGCQNPWPDDDMDIEAPDGDEMSTPDIHPQDEAPADEALQSVLSEPLRPSQVLRGGRMADPLAQPRGQLDAEDDVQELRQGETRIAWTRRQLDAGLLTPGEIDEVGAGKFGVDPRTVRRWRGMVKPK